jgi:hypothetical protein
MHGVCDVASGQLPVGFSAGTGAGVSVGAGAGVGVGVLVLVLVLVGNADVQNRFCANVFTIKFLNNVKLMA